MMLMEPETNPTRCTEISSTSSPHFTTNIINDNDRWNMLHFRVIYDALAMFPTRCTRSKVRCQQSSDFYWMSCENWRINCFRIGWWMRFWIGCNEANRLRHFSAWFTGEMHAELRSIEHRPMTSTRSHHSATSPELHFHILIYLIRLNWFNYFHGWIQPRPSHQLFCM